MPRKYTGTPEEREYYRNYQREWYKRNRAHRLVTCKANKQKLKDWVSAKKNVPCGDCGVKYPPHVMDFDHVLPGKLERISNPVARGSRLLVEKEILLCEVVCSNCHRERTHKRIVTQTVL